MKVKLIILLFQIVLFGNSLAGMNYPILLYNYPLFQDSTLTEFTLRNSSIITSGPAKSYILLCENQLIELRAKSEITIYQAKQNISIHQGTVIVHNFSDDSLFCYKISTTDTLVEILSTRQSDYMNLNSSLISIPFITNPDFYRKDAEYILKLYEKGRIPSVNYKFNFPSKRPKPFKIRSREYSGIGTYNYNTYYYGGSTISMRLYNFHLCYDLWLAFNKSGKFYSEAWNSPRDIFENIQFIQLYEPKDPFYLKIGLLENIKFSRGLLVSRYQNATFLPFEKKKGLLNTFKINNTETSIFISDILYPRFLGISFSFGDRLSTKLSYAGDFDILSEIEDTLNFTKEDYDKRRYIQGLSLFSRYNIRKTEKLNTYIDGETAILSELGIGFSLPNIGFSYRWFSYSIGFNFQSPNFRGGIFSRNYDNQKAYWIAPNDTTAEIRTITESVDAIDKWLYGWNNSVALSFQSYFRAYLSFRDIYRGKVRDKNLYLSLENHYPFSKYNITASCFVEQNNLSDLFRRKTDGQEWGFQIELSPHESINLRGRYRENYTDQNNDNKISGREEIKRSVSGSISVDGEYWWKKYRRWQKEKKTQEN